MAQSSKAALSSISIQPLADKVVISPVKKEEMTASGILLPSSNKKEQSEMGTVVAVGPGKMTDGAREAMSVKVGDKVLFSTYEDPRKMDGQEYFIIPESNILGIVTN